MTDVKRLLDQYNFKILKDMVLLLVDTPVDASPSTKREHVQVLTPILFTPQTVQKGLALLSAREKQVLAMIQRSGGEILATRLRQQLLRQRIIKPQDRKSHYSYSTIRVWRPEPHRTDFYTIIGRLMAAGLICGKGIAQVGYSMRTKIYYDNVQTFYIPQEIQPLLPEPPPLVRDAFSPEALTRVDKSSARASQRDIYLYWSVVRAAPLSLTAKEEQLYKRDLKRVNEALLVPEDVRNRGELEVPRLIFMRRLMTDIGILRQKGQTIQALDRPKFLGQNPTVRVQRTFQHWRDGTFWNEILSIPGVTVLDAGTRTENAPQRIAQARKCVLEHIAALHKEGWIPIEQLVDSLRMADYDFLLPRDFRPKPSTFYYYYGYTERTPYSAYGNEMGWNFSPSFADEAEGWEVVEAGFIRAILLEPLCWMGLVDIGYGEQTTADGDEPVRSGDGEQAQASATGEAVVYRLTPIGAWVMGVGDEVDIPEGEGRVIVQPNYEIFAMDPISDLTLAKLDEFADRVSAERAIKYTLTRESVYRAQRNKWTSARITDMLQKMSDKPLPQNVTRSLEEWQRLHERITIHRQADLLHAAESPLLDQLVANPAVRARLITRPGENVALVAPEPDKGQALIHALQEMGYVPAQTRDPQDALRPSFTISDDGQLHFRETLPSIYLYEQIAFFTGQDERGRYYLTQSAVQEALRHNLTVDDILNRLKTLHVGPLPRWIEIKVRAWGNYYGNAAMQTLTLVQFRDERILAELLREPELKGTLRPFTPSEKRALALVSTEDLESLCEALAERGIRIKRQLE
jgi:hypothetical protein